MGTCASSCFSQKNKVAPLQIDESKFIFAVQASKSETLKTKGKQSCTSSDRSLQDTNIQTQPKRACSPTISNKKERNIISCDLAERKSNSSVLNTESNSRDSFLKYSSECVKADQNYFGIGRPANPSPRGSGAFLDAVLPSNVAVDEDSTLVPNSGSCLSQTSVTSQLDFPKKARQAENIITVESQANFRGCDLQTPVAVSSSCVCPEDPSLQGAKPPYPRFESTCSIELSSSFAGKISVALDHLPLYQASELPRVTSRTRRPMHGKSSTRVPVFTDPLIIGANDGLDDDFLVDTAGEPETVGDDSLETERSRKLRPLHGKSSGRVPVFADPLLLRDCGEDYEEEIRDVTKSQPEVVGHSRTLVDQLAVGSVNNNTKETVTCEVTGGRLKLAPLQRRRKPRPLYGRSSGRVPMFTDPLIIGKDKPVRLNKIPHPPSKKNKSTSHNWRLDLDRVLLGDSGPQGGVLLAENGPSERLLTGENRPSDRALLDVNRQSKGLKVKKDAHPKLAALANPGVFQAQGSTTMSFPEIDFSGQVVSSALTSKSGRSLQKLRLLPTAIETEAPESRVKKFSIVGLNPVGTSTWGPPGDQTVEGIGQKLVLPVLRDPPVNRRTESSLCQGGSDVSEMDATVGSTHSEVELRLIETVKRSGGGRGSR